MAGIGFTPSRSMVAENVRNLQNWTDHQRRVSSGRLVRLVDKMIKRAGDVADRIGRDLRVARCRIEFGMSKQHLDHTNIDILLQEMGGKAVPQRMRRYMLLDPGSLRSRVAGTGKLACRDRLEGIAAREQPSPRAANQPPIAQQVEQPRRQHRVAVFAAFALLDPDHHPRAVDIAHLQRNDFGDPQTRP